ncbi:MAG: hypothetical protein IIY87_04495 [Bacteroidales bacterium]|nr:hypothetical protein [Bacteroidales bacterium]
MNTPLSMEAILEMLRGLSLNNRQWLAEHLVDPEELDSAQQRERDEAFVRELHALRYEGEPTAEERKKMLRESHNYGLRKINYKYADE